MQNPTEDTLALLAAQSQIALLQADNAALMEKIAAQAAQLTAAQDRLALLQARLGSILANHKQVHADLWANHQNAIDRVDQALSAALDECGNAS